MELLEQLQQDKTNLAKGLERMQEQYAQLAARIQQQSGAYQYVEMLIERVQGESAQQVDGEQVQRQGDNEQGERHEDE